LAEAKKITVTVVVSGAPQEIAIGHNQAVERLIKEALKAAGIKHPNLAEWKLRSAAGGAVIDPEQKLEAAGIAAGATLFLDPDEGGGGQVAVVAPALPPEPPAPPVLVDPAVSLAKLGRQLADWEANREAYRERGWVLLGRDGLQVDVGFCARLPITAANDLVAIPLAVRFNFSNYDVWAPSVRVIDPITRRWMVEPRVQAIDFAAGPDPSGVYLNLFVGAHPETKRVFFCKRGVREYHSHPEHSGDDWLLYRGQGHGTLGGLCELLWRLSARTVSGLNTATERFRVGEGTVALNQVLELRQQDADELAAQAQQMIAGPQLPPELLAQLAAQGGSG
jgi:hypothetical protein